MLDLSERERALDNLGIIKVLIEIRHFCSAVGSIQLVVDQRIADKALIAGVMVINAVGVIRRIAETCCVLSGHHIPDRALVCTLMMRACVISAVGVTEVAEIERFRPRRICVGISLDLIIVHPVGIPLVLRAVVTGTRFYYIPPLVAVDFLVGKIVKVGRRSPENICTVTRAYSGAHAGADCFVVCGRRVCSCAEQRHRA